MADYTFCGRCGCRIICYKPAPIPVPAEPPAGHAAAALLCCDCVVNLRARPTPGGAWIYPVPRTDVHQID